ncbi:phosphorylase [Paraburkholderia sp. NMBU_R16]|uniref:ATP adenylyltransferase family protein n=1 Tax=Paraburkholderia sp. NMBU_R16 TaxID=2698676 RepID=UPI001564DFFD|nr:phosphorylase [Paraburkholderia sp. NMBU_R16]NRO95919.1 phosphorylase [Paraburkholderia sp. NMBU_R16]
MPLSTFTPFTPGTLWPSIVRRTKHAIESGALHSIDTVATTVEACGVRFVIRQVSSLAHKAGERDAPSADPFLPYDPDLFVADVSATHVALLNKFNIVEHHLVIPTRAFEEQENLLGLADFEAWCACLAEFDGLGFYNGGDAAGASQRHKHMQILPLPLGLDGTGVPIETLFADAQQGEQASTLPHLPFEHAFTWLTPSAPEHAAWVAFERYEALLDALELGVERHDASACPPQRAPYSLLFTPRWMLLVPRTTECVEGISINALGFAGSLVVRDAAQLDTIRQLGPLEVLRRVARAPRSGVSSA